MSLDKADHRPPDRAIEVVLLETQLSVHETKLNGLISGTLNELIQKEETYSKIKVPDVIKT